MSDISDFITAVNIPALDFKCNGYAVVKNILSKDLSEFLGEYAYHKNGGNYTDIQVPNTPSFYADEVMQNLLHFLLPDMEKYTGMSLLPAYSYFRVYKKGDILKRHRDRPSCEISVTLCIKGDDWPIYIENYSYKKDRDLDDGYEFEALLKPGDGMIYHGCECEHWRNEFADGEKLAQVFLHYIDKNGLNTERYINDGMNFSMNYTRWEKDNNGSNPN